KEGRVRYFCPCLALTRHSYREGASQPSPARPSPARSPRGACVTLPTIAWPPSATETCRGEDSGLVSVQPLLLCLGGGGGDYWTTTLDCYPLLTTWRLRPSPMLR